MEAFTLELAHRMGFEVAFGRVCTWTDGEGTVHRGLASRKFHGEDETQTTGAELIASELNVPCDTSSEKRSSRPLITSAVVRRVLETQGARFGVDLVSPFLAMLIFDAWIGNADRHSGNWALLTGASMRLAPMYDTAGCLGAELTDETLASKLRRADRAAMVARYVERCPSGFGDGRETPGIFQRDLLDELRAWPEWGDIAHPLIIRVSSSLGVVEELLEDIPEDWFPRQRREFARALLVARATLLGVLR